jgi:hypothetical protein
VIKTVEEGINSHTDRLRGEIFGDKFDPGVRLAAGDLFGFVPANVLEELEIAD